MPVCPCEDLRSRPGSVLVTSACSISKNLDSGYFLSSPVKIGKWILVGTWGFLCHSTPSESNTLKQV